jgi:hypothetical protein
LTETALTGILEKTKVISMKPKSTLSAIGGWNSFFFCLGMYFVALFFSIFVCSSIFYVVNSNKASKASMAEKSSARTELVAAIK